MPLDLLPVLDLQPVDEEASSRLDLQPVEDDGPRFGQLSNPFEVPELNAIRARAELPGGLPSLHVNEPVSAAELAPISREQLAMEETWNSLSEFEKAQLGSARVAKGLRQGLATSIKGVANLSEMTNPKSFKEGLARVLFPPYAVGSMARRAGEKTPEEAHQLLAESPLYQTGVEIEKEAEKMFPTTQPESVSRPIAAVGETVTQMVPMILAGLTTGGTGALAVGFGMEGQGAYEREMARQEREGEPADPGKAFYKGFGIYGPISTTIEARLGVGRLFRNFAKQFGEEAAKEVAGEASKKGFPTAFKEFSIRRAKDSGAEAVTEGLQSVAEQLIVEGNVELGEVLHAAALGAGAGVVLGGGLEAVGGAGRVLDRRAAARAQTEQPLQPDTGPVVTMAAPAPESTPMEPLPVLEPQAPAAVKPEILTAPEAPVSPTDLTAANPDMEARIAAIKAKFAAAQKDRVPVKVVGPDGKEYAATFDGMDTMVGGERGPVRQITTTEAIPGVSPKGGTTYDFSLAEKGFTIKGLPETKPAPSTVAPTPAETATAEVPGFAARYNPETLMQRPAWVEPGSKLDKVLGELREKNNPLSGVDIAPIWKQLTPEQRQDLAARGWVVTSDRNPNAVVLKIGNEVPPARNYWGMQNRRAAAAAPAPVSGTAETAAKPLSPKRTANTEFDQLAIQHGIETGTITRPDVLGVTKQHRVGDSMTMAAKLEESKQVQKARNALFAAIGEPHATTADRARLLPKLKAYLERYSKLESKPLNEVGIGDQFSIMGEPYFVENVTADGMVTLKDGKTIRVDDDQTVRIDPGSYQAVAQTGWNPETPLPTPKLASGVNQGDLITSTQQEDFALVGERGTDTERIAETARRADQAKREAAELAKKQQGEFPMSRISEEGGEFDPFTANEGDLADYFNERFGEQQSGGVSGEARGESAFPTYESFNNWMKEAMDARDLEALKDGFARAPTEFKVRYIKENRAADEVTVGVIRHLGTGSPIPQGFSPATGLAPRPLPGQAPTSPQPSTSTRPGQPPPPPRPSPNAPHHVPFDITALVQLLRYLNKFPVMNQRLKRAYGRYKTATENVELKSRLLWDQALAKRVLGHEIGHFIDLAIPLIGKSKQFAQRIRPLFDFRGQMWKATELRNEARSLSRQWRGNFNNGDTYRDTAQELFADFLSAILTNPEWVNQNYGKLFDAFQDLRDSKPQFKSAFREIETWLQGGTVADELMAQDVKAVERTADLMSQPDPKARASMRDRLVFDLVTLWNRAFQIEGRPRKIGTSITEKLEQSYLWSAMKMSLWNDTYLKTVQTVLDRVDSDATKARSYLLSLTKAVRTIGERRAAGVWIEQNPEAARQMLAAVLNLDPATASKFTSALNTAADSELYDLSAAIFREIHDRGDKFVDRIATALDRLDLGVDGEAALMAFNVRGKLLNPGGLTVDSAREVMKKLRNELGSKRFSDLATAAQSLRDLIFSTQQEMHDAGLISDKTWNELIVPNRQNYVPYAVLDYFDGHVRAGVMPQTGTAKDVADVVMTSQLKAASAYSWLQKQRQVQLLQQVYERGGQPVAVGKELKRAQELDRIRSDNSRDAVSRAVIWQDGKPHLIKFPDDPGKLLQDALSLPEFYSHLEWLHGASRINHQAMQLFTQLSPRFLFYRNIVRGFRTAGLKVGYWNAMRQLSGSNFKRNYRFAVNYAQAAFGGEMLPEVRRMVELEALPPPRVAAGSVRDLPNMRELLIRGSMPAFAIQRVKEEAPTTAGAVRDTLRQGKNVTDKIFTGYEAFEKIYNYMAALEKGLPEERSAAIARRGGIPRPGVSGKWSSVAEIIFPWTRVRTQGIRSGFQMARDPELRAGFLTRFAVFEAAPRMAKVAIGVGLVSQVFKWLMRSDEDEDDPVMTEVAQRISPYKMALDDMVPFAFYDARTGEYHPFWRFKRGADVPRHYEVVSIRIPSSEEGITFGSMLYQLMLSEKTAGEKMGRPGETVTQRMGQWATSQLAPSLNPFMETSSQLIEMIAKGRNPRDPWTGGPAANPLLFDAGGVDRAQAIAGFLLNELGGPGEAAAILAGNLGLLDSRALNALDRRLKSDKRPWSEKFPWISTAVSHDNYADYRESKTSEIEDTKIRARARLAMPDNARILYDFYYTNLKRKDSLSDQDRNRFEASKHFVQHVWGSVQDPEKFGPTYQQPSFYARYHHAWGPDGSKQSKESLKRDLEEAARPYLLEFEPPPSP